MGIPMRTVTLAWLFTMLSFGHALAQEDVLRPNGRDNSTKEVSERTPTRLPAGSAKSGSALVIRGGIEGGLGLNMYSKDIEGILPTSPLTVFNSGAGISPTYGVYAEVEISPTVAIGLRMMVDHKSVVGSKSDLLQDCLITDEYGVPLQVTVAKMSGEFTIDQTFFTFTPVLRVDLADNLFAQVGPTIHLPTENQRTTITQTIDPSEACKFNFGQPNESSVSVITSEVTSFPAMRIGLDAAIGYRLSVGDGLEVVPRIGYQLMFTPLDNQDTGTDQSRASTDPPVRDFVARAATLNSLQATISLWFRL